MDVDEIEIFKFRYFKYLNLFENCPSCKAIKVTYLSQIVMNFKQKLRTLQSIIPSAKVHGQSFKIY